MSKINPLAAVARYEVRFNECDPMGVVWHGNFIRFFEEGREAFAKKFDFDFKDMFEKGYALPIVHVTCDYKRPLKYRDVALIEATFHKSAAAKIIFDYKIYLEETGELTCKGTTTQVFVNRHTMELSLVYPDIFVEWAVQKGLK